ncbi:hypothetical protein ABQF35_11125 [Mycobacterium syngnathidarum]
MTLPDLKPACTLSQAADALGLTTQRVLQMLGDRTLTGPPKSDESKSLSNAPRVWSASLADEIARRRARGVLVGDERRAAKQSRQQSRRHSPEQPSNHDRGARAAAQHMKVAADLARDHMRDMQRKNRRLRNIILTMSVELARIAESELSASDDLLDQYESALRELLVDDDTSDLKA